TVCMLRVQMHQRYFHTEPTGGRCRHLCHPRRTDLSVCRITKAQRVETHRYGRLVRVPRRQTLRGCSTKTGVWSLPTSQPRKRWIRYGPSWSLTWMPPAVATLTSWVKPPDAPAP